MIARRVHRARVLAVALTFAAAHPRPAGSKLVRPDNWIAGPASILPLLGGVLPGWRRSALRRELYDHLIVVSERQLLRAVRAYVAYYNDDRPHLALGGDAPISRPVEPLAAGRIIALPRVGELHHRYARAA